MTNRAALTGAEPQRAQLRCGRRIFSALRWVVLRQAKQRLDRSPQL